MWGLFRFSGRQLLLALLLLLIAYPFFEDLPWGDFALSSLVTFVLISALLAVGGRRGALAIGLLFILPALALHWLPHFTTIGREDTVPVASMALAIGYTIWQLMRFVLRAPHVNSEVLCSGISIYLLLGLFWAQLYVLVQNADAATFYFPYHPSMGLKLSGYDAVYLSFSTITTCNFGDIIPVSRYARSLTSLESLFGVLYVAVLIARLMALYTKPSHTPADGPKSHEK
jgi:hypothetical protein